ncbi:MAG: hypothetical protein ACK4E1_07630, partial [Fervidobacterium nodosum]
QWKLKIIKKKIKELGIFEITIKEINPNNKWVKASFYRFNADRYLELLHSLDIPQPLTEDENNNDYNNSTTREVENQPLEWSNIQPLELSKVQPLERLNFNQSKTSSNALGDCPNSLEDNNFDGGEVLSRNTPIYTKNTSTESTSTEITTTLYKDAVGEGSYAPSWVEEYGFKDADTAETLMKVVNWKRYPHPTRPNIKTTIRQMLMDVLCVNRLRRELFPSEEQVAVRIQKELDEGKLTYEKFAECYRSWEYSNVARIGWLVKSLWGENEYGIEGKIKSLETKLKETLKKLNEIRDDEERMRVYQTEYVPLDKQLKELLKIKNNKGGNKR